MNAGALKGIRVVEFTHAVAGPTAGYVLADMGAEVIKVEQPAGRGRRQTVIAPAVEGAPDEQYNRMPHWNEMHRGKRHVAIDVTKPAGREALLRLVAISDVVIENFSPRAMRNMHLQYDDLCEANPSIILVSMPAFGATGPYASRGSYGPGIDAMSGMSHLTGYPDRGPGKPANYFCDQNAGMLAAFSTLAAIRHCRRTGEGQHLELAMLDGELQAIAPALMDASMNGHVQSRIGNRHAWLAPQGVYRSRGDDSWVAISVATDEQWRALCAVIERPDLASDPALATHEGRYARHDELDGVIEMWTSARTHHVAQAALQAAGVPAGAVLDVPEAFDDPQLVHRESFVRVEHPHIGAFPHIRTAWRSRRGNDGVTGTSPLFGEATEYVLCDLIGMSEAEVDKLVSSGTVTNAPVR